MPTPVFVLADLFSSLTQPLVLAFFLSLFPPGTFSHEKALATPRWRFTAVVFLLTLTASVPASVVKSAFQRGAVVSGSEHPILIGVAVGLMVLVPCVLLVRHLALRLFSRPA